MSEILLFCGGVVTGLLLGGVVSFLALAKLTGTVVGEALDDLIRKGYLRGARDE